MNKAKEKTRKAN